MYKVDIYSTRDFEFKAKAGNAEFVIDAKGNEFTPPDALLAALGSCIGVYIRKYAEGAKITLNNFTIHLEAEFSKELSISIKHIYVAIDLKTAGLDERRSKSLLDFIKNCPVHNTLKGNPEIEIELI